MGYARWVYVALHTTACISSAGAVRDLGVCVVGQLRGICAPEDLRSFFDVFLREFTSADILFVVPEEECERANSLLAVAIEFVRPGMDAFLAALCVPESLSEPAEVKWLEDFPNSLAGRHYFDTARFRNTLLPAKHLAECGAQLAERAGTHGGYRWAARVRPDVHWHSFLPQNDLEIAAPPLILANFVPLPIQGVVEDQFSIGAWPVMERYFNDWYQFLLDPRRSWGTQIRVPWCIEHATLRKREICHELFTENMLETYFRLELQVQLHKRRAICFDKVVPCMRPRSAYCNHLSPSRHAHGFLQSDPDFYNQFDRDYFLTAPGIYADFDGQLATRLVRFFRDEVKNVAGDDRPARVIDLGCGRGGYVEALIRWGVAAVGVDGDAVITRTLPHHGILHDLTEPFDLVNLHRATQSQFCTFNGPFKESSPDLGRKLALLTQVNVGWLDESDAALFMQHLCCSDLRCVAWSSSPPPLGTLWRLRSNFATDTMDESDDMSSFLASLEIYVRNGFSSASNLRHELREAHSELWPLFRTADWALSLGVGQHIPREFERVFLENIVRHAMSGIVLSWGTSQDAVNVRTHREIIMLFESLGFSSDEQAARDLRLFAGLAYGGPRTDLVVLRRRRVMLRETMHYSWLKPASIQVLSVWGRSECIPGRTYGLHLPHYVWISKGCGGLFKCIFAGVAYVVLCVSISNDYKECAFCIEDVGAGRDQVQTGGLPRMESIPASALPKGLHKSESVHHMVAPAALSRLTGSMLAESSLQMHAASDHFVPVASAWLGDERLNVVFYKMARRLSPAMSTASSLAEYAGQLQRAGHPRRALRGDVLALEWAWLWRTEWRGLLDADGMGKRSKVQRPLVKSQYSFGRLRQVFDVLLRLASQLGPPRVVGRVRSVRWWRVSRLFSRAIAVAKRRPRDLLGRHGRLLHRGASRWREAAWRRAALAQRAVADLVASTPPSLALREAPLARLVLPAARRLAAELQTTRALPSFKAPAPGCLGFSCRSRVGSRSRACSVAEDEQAPWDLRSAEGWYLYRLAACDPTV